MNRPIKDWSTSRWMGDTSATSAILDRFLEKVHFIKMTGRSYHLRKLNHKQKPSQNQAKKE